MFSLAEEDSSRIKSTRTSNAIEDWKAYKEYNKEREFASSKVTITGMKAASTKEFKTFKRNQLMDSSNT